VGIPVQVEENPPPFKSSFLLSVVLNDFFMRLTKTASAFTYVHNYLIIETKRKGVKDYMVC